MSFDKATYDALIAAEIPKKPTTGNKTGNNTNKTGNSTKSAFTGLVMMAFNLSALCAIMFAF